MLTLRIGEIVYCTNCGSKLATGQRFCASCGSSISASSKVSKAKGQFVGDEEYDRDDALYVDWVKKDTSAEWAKFFANAAKTEFAGEREAVKVWTRKFKVKPKVYDYNLKADRKLFEQTDKSFVWALWEFYAGSSYERLSGEMELVAYLTSVEGWDPAGEIRGIAWGGLFVIASVPATEDTYTTVAASVHCPRCTALLLEEDDEAEWPEEGQFEDCPACQGNTPVWVDFTGFLAGEIG